MNNQIGPTVKHAWNVAMHVLLIFLVCHKHSTLPLGANTAFIYLYWRAPRPSPYVLKATSKFSQIDPLHYCFLVIKRANPGLFLFIFVFSAQPQLKYNLIKACAGFEHWAAGTELWRQPSCIIVAQEIDIILFRKR